MNKYPNKADWSVVVLFEGSDEEALEKEVEFIATYDTFKNGYNMAIGGGLGWRDTPLSEDHKRKIGAANRGKSPSTDARLKMRIAKLGKKRGPYSDEHRKNISEALKQWNARKKV